MEDVNYVRAQGHSLCNTEWSFNVCWSLMCVVVVFANSGLCTATLCLRYSERQKTTEKTHIMVDSLTNFASS